MSLDEPRIRVPAEVRRGETVTLKALLTHPMESGLRADGAGNRVPRRIVAALRVTFEGEEVLACRLEPAMAANPYFEFDVVATRSGRFRFVFTEDGGAEAIAEADITVT